MSLASQLSAAFTRVGTEFKTVRTEIATLVGDKSTLSTTSKTNIVSAINEIVGELGGAGVSIDDTTASGSTVYSSTKTNSAISAAVAALVNSSPGTLDTLKELADAINDDASYAATVTTALGTKAPLASPTFTGTPAAPTPTTSDSTTKVATTAYVQANTGDVTTDFAAAFTAALT